MATNDTTNPAATGVKVKNLAAQGAHGKLEARLYTPPDAPASGLIVFFPYGGFVTVELEEAEGFAMALAARTRYRVLATSYTVATQSPFPAAVEDAHAVLKWAVRNRTRLGWDGKRLLTAGIEAGGNLAAVASLVARDRGGPALSAQLLIMPMLDPGLTTCSMRSVAGQGGAARAADACAAGYRDYLPRALDRTHPYACPMQSSRMKGLPPALILSADDDPLRDEAEQYGMKLTAAGIPATVRRLPPIELEAPDARCSCARKENVLQEIAAFIDGLQ
ncbi:alpha/beta hydrolase [Noviherbaspirillum denitrificans]|uniref:Alpha/beta hydrolase n=1 Tax=Noviherbaspirillum denitrificans TaxID=1968433 RepID=A0A254TJ24_9BURK|nr:alpha/beta hydrolase [Noviherbaspirillum denitrificans]OWW19698.1 alpha/beta hydrolase [Noviherbaspirillum denitrificans]